MSIKNNTTGLQAILAAVNALPEAGETLPDLIADEPETMGQRACLANAAQLRDIQYTLRGSMPVIGGTYNTGKVVTGLPYSSVRKTDRFVGFNISLYTFMTAINNPRSLLYTTTAADNTADNGNIANTYYGTNCSTYASYCHGWLYHSATNVIPELPYIEEVDPADMKLCDMPVASLDHGGTVGHATLITAITRNQDGTIKTLELSESTGPVIRATTMSYESFITNYIDGQGYRVYRDSRLYEASYKATSFVKVFEEEPTVSVVYSSLCTNRGDKVAIAPEEDIVLNVLIDSGYEAVKLYKDGTEIAEYTVTDGSIIDGDVALSKLTAGTYTAILYDASGAKISNAYTSFEVVEATVTQNGNRFTYSSLGGVPVRVVYKDSGGYTLAVFDMTEEEVAQGYKSVTDYHGETPAQVCVPFKTKYGFIVARLDYDPTPVVPEEPEVDLPDMYQQLKYVETSGGQYIDTGILASDYPEGIMYTFHGNRTGVTSTTQVSYIWGALYDGSRSGNMAIIPADNGYGVICGANSGILNYTAWSKEGVDFTLTLRATSTQTGSASELPATLNGNAFIWSSAGTNIAMPQASIYLFAVNGVDTTRGYLGKCYRFTMSDVNGNLLRDFVPARRVADSVIGMYDTVQEVFHENAGSGSFTGQGNDTDESTVLPEAFQKVAYISTDGNQFIDTGVVASNYPAGIEYQFQGNMTGCAVSDNNNYMFGCLANGSRSGNLTYDTRQAEYPLGLYIGGTTAVLKRAATPMAFGSDFSIQVKCTSTASSTDEIIARINGVDFFDTGTPTYPSAMPSANIHLFTASGVSSSNGKYYGKLYKFTMADANGNLIRNFVPCYRKSDSVVGLYDPVSSTFFTNAGTGSFTAGPEV